MNERQFNAIRACEQSAALIARKYGWDAPAFYLPYTGDNDIEFWRSAEAMSTFLAKVAGVDKASAAVIAKPVIASNVAESVDFTQVSGISDEIQLALYEAGYLTWEDILQAGIVKLQGTVSGIGMRRAQALFKKARLEAE